MSMALRLKSQDSEALKDFLGRLQSALRHKLIEVKLFGSKARGEDAPDSDIDVLVVVNEAGVEIEDQVLDIAFEVNLDHEVYISPRVIDHAILDDPVWKITPFLKAIDKEGIAL